jgi:hypothetical protein
MRRCRETNVHLAIRFGEKLPATTSHEGGEGVESRGRELILEDAGSLREGLWRMARLAQQAAEALDSRIEDGELDGETESAEIREALERVQTISLEVSEELDAYQNRHGR